MIRQHWLSQSQWQLPTAEHYATLRDLFNSNGGEYLRREYEDLRRPFVVSSDVPYTDVWTFSTVRTYPGKHPCEKPGAMLEHVINVSTREGATVLDSFMGSGTTGIACKRLNRNFIGIEKKKKYYDTAVERINNVQGVLQ